MAKIYPDLAGGYKGAVGGTTYYFWKGDNIARKKGVPGKKSKSGEAVEQRMKFAELGIFSRKRGWKWTRIVNRMIGCMVSCLKRSRNCVAWLRFARVARVAPRR